MKVVFRCCGLIILGLILFFIPTALPDAAPPPSTEGCTSLGNPAAAYCETIMGYDYQVVTAADSAQNGVCAMPDGETCDQWDFYAGTCGQAYSWCEQAGYKLETRTDGKDPYAQEYSVCVDNQGRAVGSTITLSGLSALVNGADVEISKTGIEQSTVAPQPVGVNPPSFDWRNYLGQNWVTPVKNQASCGSCWAFSTVGLTEAQHNIIPANPSIDLNLAEQYLVSDCCSYGDCGGGIDVYALEYIRDSGVPDEGCYPYTGVNSACSSRCADWASRLEYVPNAHYNYTDYTPSDMKFYLSNYGPITITMGIDEDFGGYWDGDIYRCADDSGTNHSILAVGYNDAGGYWIAKNSWGSGWNGDGYFKIGYGECGVQDSQISWVQSSLPIPHKTFLPLVIKPVSAPGAFNKISPSNGATGQGTSPTLTWGISSGATRYDYCYDTTNDNTCSAWLSNGTSTSKALSGLSLGTTYYWHVRAVNTKGTTYSNGSSTAFWSFTSDTVSDPILNGNFEAGGVSWTEYSKHGWDLIINSGFPGTVTPHGGSWAVWLGGDYDDTSYISQTVTIPAGRSHLHFWYWIASDDVCGYDYFKIYADASLEGTWNLCDENSTVGWTETSIDLTAFAGYSKLLKFEVTADYILNSNLFLDDVSFEVLAVTSQPVVSSEPVLGAARARE